MDIVSLPREILAEIFLLYLSKQDLKSLRLVCSEFTGVTTPTLFYRIRISPLLQDFESFFGISRSPHLADHVRVLVWEELGGFFHTDELYWPQWTGSDRQLFKDVTENASKLFLLDIENVSGDFTFAMDMISDASSIPRSNLPNEFLSAIRDTMPNLHTLVSKPMDCRRCLKIPSMDYTMSIEALKRILQFDETACLLNFGFTAFLLPAMEALAVQSKNNDSANKITRLFYADEGDAVNTHLTRINSCDKAFEHLRHLDLCVTVRDSNTLDLSSFWACLSNAKSLTSLKLCSEGGPVPFSPGNIPTLPQLTEVEFVELNLVQDPWILTTVDFIKRHAGTLKRLYFTSSQIRKKLLKALAKMNSLQLERFVITSGHNHNDGDNDNELIADSDEEFMNEHIDEMAVLNYVNLTNGSSQEKPAPSFRLQDGEKRIYTHPLIFDPLTAEVAAFHDTRDNAWGQRGYDPMDVSMLDAVALDRRDEHGIAYDIGPRRIYHSVTGLWLDSDGVFYCPVTDEEVEVGSTVCVSSRPDSTLNHASQNTLQATHQLLTQLPNNEEVNDLSKKGENPEGSWAFQGQRTWDSEMGLWRDEGGKLKKFAVDREPLGKPGLTDEDFEDSEYEVNLDMQPFYDGEEDDFLLRIENAPRWDWGRDKEGEIWYWKVGESGTAGRAGHATEMWYFEHKGEQAYGNDPLEFWADWYGGPEDEAEPTPYGWNLLAFINTEDVGRDIPTCESIHRYESEKDPMLMDTEGRWWGFLPKPADFEVQSKEEWGDEDSPLYFKQASVVYRQEF
ncbi:hypothetical protein FBEOM_8683 [Fusarium beomiforme]|uniref:F-box domain-containing protein n=1 Tax=Fusarium beomiforme TaxID=44412 RepID=A0A9P5DWM0_9HYPO|nr:hypothetical protein FBEOM_8683 [Fusarium beomiforme]